MKVRESAWNTALILLLTGFASASAAAQEYRVIRSAGDAAVIDAGSADGIQSGDLFRVFRRQGGSEREVATARVTHVLFNMTRIAVTERTGNETILEGDLAEKIEEASMGTPEQSGPAVNRRTAPSGLQRPPAQRVKGVYLGPTAGMFLPLGDMKDVFENNFGYGGILGLQFKSDLDVSMRFFFTAKSTEWSFWNLQLLGRRYVNERVLFDFGYGISYHKIGAAQFGSGDILLGFIGGTGYTFPVGMNTWMELGALYHYYPHFGDKAGQFITMQARLIL